MRTLSIAPMLTLFGLVACGAAQTHGTPSRHDKVSDGPLPCRSTLLPALGVRMCLPVELVLETTVEDKYDEAGIVVAMPTARLPALRASFARYQFQHREPRPDSSTIVRQDANGWATLDSYEGRCYAEAWNRPASLACTMARRIPCDEAWTVLALCAAAVPVFPQPEPVQDLAKTFPAIEPRARDAMRDWIRANPAEIFMDRDFEPRWDAAKLPTRPDQIVLKNTSHFYGTRRSPIFKRTADGSWTRAGTMVEDLGEP